MKTQTRVQTATRLLRFSNSNMGAAVPSAPTFDPITLPFSVVFEARTGRRLDALGSPASLPGDPVAVWQSRATGNLEAAQSTFAAANPFCASPPTIILRFRLPPTRRALATPSRLPCAWKPPLRARIRLLRRWVRGKNPAHVFWRLTMWDGWAWARSGRDFVFAQTPRRGERAGSAPSSPAKTARSSAFG